MLNEYRAKNLFLPPKNKNKFTFVNSSGDIFARITRWQAIRIFIA